MKANVSLDDLIKLKCATEVLCFCEWARIRRKMQTGITLDLFELQNACSAATIALRAKYMLEAAMEPQLEVA